MGTDRLADELEARAATFRRLAGELLREEDREALIRIAEDYEREAAGRRSATPPSERRP